MLRKSRGRHHWLTLIVVLCISPGIVRAQAVLSLGEVEKRQPPTDDVEVEEITRFAPLPDPALKYRFWPAVYELQPGDGMPLYLRGVLMHRGQPGVREYDRAYYELTEEGLSEPLTDDEVEAAKDVLEMGAAKNALRELRRAALRQTTSRYHRVEALSGVEVFEYLLPEVQEMRSLARMLDLQIRIAIAEEDYAEASRLIRDGFRLGSSVGGEKLIISELVGAAISGIMLENTRRLSMAPGGPNVYWALATLPRPLVSLDEAIAFETSFAERFFAEPLPPSGEEHAGAWQAYALEKARNLARVTGREEVGVGFEAAVALNLITAYPEAKEALREYGYTQQEIDAMSAVETVVRSIREEFQRTGQQLEAWSLLPIELGEETREALGQLEEEYRQRGDERLTALPALLWAATPAVEAANRVDVRTQVQVDARMTIEAIRAHVAETGELPMDLQGLQPVPSLPDPRTGDPFPWKVVEEAGQKVGVLEVDMRPLQYRLFRYRFILGQD